MKKSISVNKWILFGFVLLFMMLLAAGWMVVRASLTGSALTTSSLLSLRYAGSTGNGGQVIQGWIWAPDGNTIENNTLKVEVQQNGHVTQMIFQINQATIYKVNQNPTTPQNLHANDNVVVHTDPMNPQLAVEVDATPLRLHW